MAKNREQFAAGAEVEEVPPISIAFLQIDKGIKITDLLENNNLVEAKRNLKQKVDKLKLYMDDYLYLSNGALLDKLNFGAKEPLLLTEIEVNQLNDFMAKIYAVDLNKLDKKSLEELSTLVHKMSPIIENSMDTIDQIRSQGRLLDDRQQKLALEGIKEISKHEWSKQLTKAMELDSGKIALLIGDAEKRGYTPTAADKTLLNEQLLFSGTRMFFTHPFRTIGQFLGLSPSRDTITKNLSEKLGLKFIRDENGQASVKPMSRMHKDFDAAMKIFEDKAQQADTPANLKGNLGHLKDILTNQESYNKIKVEMDKISELKDSIPKYSEFTGTPEQMVMIAASMNQLMNLAPQSIQKEMGFVKDNVIEIKHLLNTLNEATFTLSVAPTLNTSEMWKEHLKGQIQVFADGIGVSADQSRVFVDQNYVRQTEPLEQLKLLVGYVDNLGELLSGSVASKSYDPESVQNMKAMLSSARAGIAELQGKGNDVTDQNITDLLVPMAALRDNVKAVSLDEKLNTADVQSFTNKMGEFQAKVAGVAQPAIQEPVQAAEVEPAAAQQPPSRKSSFVDAHKAREENKQQQQESGRQM